MIQGLEGNREETARLERELEHWTREFEELKARASGIREPQMNERKDALEITFEQLRARMRGLKAMRGSLARELEVDIEDSLGTLETALEDFASDVVRAGR